MRFASIYPLLSLGTVRKEKFVLALDGQRDKTQDSISVNFTQEYLTQDDIDFALSFFPANVFRGRYLEEDRITLQPLAERIGVFDTEIAAQNNGWSDEEKQMVEEWIQRHPALGREFVECIPVVKVIEKPWPSYNSIHHFKVAKTAIELGLAEQTLAYEKANKNRQNIIDALEEHLENNPTAELDDSGEVVAA